MIHLLGAIVQYPAGTGQERTPEIPKNREESFVGADTGTS